MGRIVLYPYKLASASSKQIAEALKRHGKQVIRVYPSGKYRPRPDDFIINWGNTEVPEWDTGTIINKPSAVSLAVNKLKTLEILHEEEVRHVPFTTDIGKARDWGADGFQIVERHRLEGYGGDGILISDEYNLSDAPLYTKLLNPCDEYRVHVFMGNVIDYTKKVKRGARDDFIKNLEHGWYFLRDVQPRSGVIRRALDAVEALGLDFGAVDVLRYNDKSYVLEVNTAVGLSPLGVTSYVNEIIKYA